MKNTNNILIAALAGIALSLLSGSTQAQVKGGERMMQHNGRATTATVTPNGSTPMSCATCKDVSTTVLDATAKGAVVLVAHGAPTKTVASHLCGGCATTRATVGVGKHRQDAATHTCASGGTESSTCCNTAK